MEAHSVRHPFTSATHLNSQKKQSQQSQGKAKNDVRDICGPQQIDLARASLNHDRSHFENLDKPQLVHLVIAQQRVLSTCFDENDQLRDRLSKLEALYAAAQDEIELRDRAIEEMAKLIETE
jgi:hypothetical protein